VAESPQHKHDTITAAEDDQSLAARVISGDVAAFEAILKKYWPGVTLFAARLLNDREAAKDVTQETFIRLWQGRTQVRPDLLRAYLYRVARNLVSDELRKRAVRTRWTRNRPPGSRAAESPEQIFDSREVHVDVVQAILALPPRRREAFTLVFLHDLSYKEVAAVMGISAATVKNQISAALTDLRTALAHHRRD
jgi:RNA polymerase sigma-70 factor (ECF subfamily)